MTFLLTYRTQLFTYFINRQIDDWNKWLGPMIMLYLHCEATLLCKPQDWHWFYIQNKHHCLQLFVLGLNWNQKTKSLLEHLWKKIICDKYNKYYIPNLGKVYYRFIKISIFLFAAAHLHNRNLTNVPCSSCCLQSR